MVIASENETGKSGCPERPVTERVDASELRWRCCISTDSYPPSYNVG